jgi:hypothetical protein
MHRIIDELRTALPPVFLGSRTGELTGTAIDWATILCCELRRGTATWALTAMVPSRPVQAAP